MKLPRLLRYNRKFFYRLAKAMACRVGYCQEAEHFFFDEARPVTVIALWNVMAEAVRWVGTKHSVTFSRGYEDPAQQLTPAELADDLVELAAWYAGINGQAVRVGQRFPATAYQRDLLATIYFAFCQALFEGVPFGQVFSAAETENATLLIGRVLQGATAREQWDAYQPLRDRISVAALELLQAAVEALDPQERAAFCAVVDSLLAEAPGFVTRAQIWRALCLYASIVCQGELEQPLWLSFPPFFALLPRLKRPERPRDDFRPIPQV